MGACPFCGGEVSEDLLLNGGHCPHCLIEIPGEDTPTDPGEAAQAQQAAEEQAVKRGQSNKLIAGGVVALLGLVGGAVVLLAPSETGPMQIEMGEFEFAPMSEHQDLAMPQAEQPEPVAQKKTSTRRSTSSGTSAPQRTASAGTGAAPAPATSGSGSVATASAPPPTGGQLGGDPGLADPLDADMFFGAGPAKKGVQAIELCKPGEIYEAVRGVMKVKSPQVRQCYDRALKSNESLSGRWMASFVIGKDGGTTKVNVRGEGVSDSGLEGCLVQQIERWTFPPLCEPMPIETPFTFAR